MMHNLSVPMPAHACLGRHIAAALVTGILLLPSAGWIAYAWDNSPQDSRGPLFAALALVWWVLVAVLGRRSERDRARGFDPSGIPLILMALATGAAGHYLDINVLKAVAPILLGWSLVWFMCGGRIGLLLMPSMLIGLFALPATSYLIGEIYLALGLVSPGNSLVKLVIAILMLVAGTIALTWLRWRRAHHTDEEVDKRWSPTLVDTSFALLALITLAGLALAFRPIQFGPSVRLDASQWSFGDWLGAEINTTPMEQRLYGQARLSKRVYARPDGGRVAVLIVDSNDVHDLHAPEYCLTGSGWRMDERVASPWAVGAKAISARAGQDPQRDGANLDQSREPAQGAAAAELTASNGNMALQGVYWFSNDSHSTTDLTGLRLHARLSPDEPFTLYMLTVIDHHGSNPGSVLEAFIEDAPWLSPRTGIVK